jgi:hypothetical protein
MRKTRERVKRCPLEHVSGSRPWERRQRYMAYQLKDAAWFAEEVCTDLGIPNVRFNAIAANRKKASKTVLRVVLEQAPSLETVKRVEESPLLSALVWWYDECVDERCLYRSKWETNHWCNSAYDGIVLSVNRTLRWVLHYREQQNDIGDIIACDGVR